MYIYKLYIDVLLFNIWNGGIWLKFICNFLEGRIDFKVRFLEKCIKDG